MNLDTDPFHRHAWPDSIIHPTQYGRGERLRLCWDLGRVDGSEKKRAIKAWVAELPKTGLLQHLSLWSQVTQPLFDAACEARQLESLQIKWSNIQRLDAIANLKRLTALSIGSSTRVKSIEPLAELQGLRYLELENFKLITDFSALAKLPNLRVLAVTGSMWTRQTVASLEPFATMTRLESLAIDTSRVTTIRPLANLTNLKKLGVGGRLPFEEYAWLAAKLPNTECARFSPFLELADTGFRRCKACGEDSMVLLTGKGKPIICRFCDSAKFDKHVEAFHQVRDAAARGA